MLSLFKRWRRRRILATPFSKPWESILRHNVPYFNDLTEPQRERVRRSSQVIAAEKYWEGIEGFRVTDEVKITIAGTASLLLLGQTESYFFDSVKTIIVYPDVIERSRSVGDGMVDDQPQQVAGEAWQGGPLIFSWPDVIWQSERPRDGNVVIHEFAHHIDGLDGEMGGIPLIHDPDMRERWKSVFDHEYQELVIASNLGQRTLIDSYAATNKAEFFAVTSETFVAAPHRLQKAMPDVYTLLSEFYAIDPITWSR